MSGMHLSVTQKKLRRNLFQTEICAAPSNLSQKYAKNPVKTEAKTDELRADRGGRGKH
jgi:hypothetical protein